MTANRASADVGARTRPLAGLPDVERRLPVAGVATAIRTMRHLLKSQTKQIPTIELERIITPTSLLGRHDRAAPFRSGEWASLRLRWPLQVVEAAGHVPHIEQPAAFLRTLSEVKLADDDSGRTGITSTDSDGSRQSTTRTISSGEPEHAPKAAPADPPAAAVLITGVFGSGKSSVGMDEHARLVVGADGSRSLVARAVRPRLYNEKPRLLAGYYAYWSGLPTGGRFESYTRPGRAFAAWPTHDDRTLLMGTWPFAEFAANKSNIEGNVLAMLQLAPPFAERVRSATRQSRYVGTAVPNFFRKPYGPGWALAGDSGYTKDFITGHGIHDAFRDAELCATALDETFSGARSYDVAMSGYHNARDEQVLPMYEYTTQLATLAPPPREQQQLLAAVHGDSEAMDAFARVQAGVTSPADFFSAENVARIFDRQRLRVG